MLVFIVVLCIRANQCVSISRRMREHNEVYSYTETAFSLRKEWTSLTCYNTEAPYKAICQGHNLLYPAYSRKG